MSHESRNPIKYLYLHLSHRYKPVGFARARLLLGLRCPSVLRSPGISWAVIDSLYFHRWSIYIVSITTNNNKKTIEVSNGSWGYILCLSFAYFYRTLKSCARFINKLKWIKLHEIGTRPRYSNKQKSISDRVPVFLRAAPKRRQVFFYLMAQQQFFKKNKFCICNW